MNRSDYRLLRSHQGLRDAAQSAVSKEPPTRTALAEALTEAGMPASMVDEHVDKLAELAKQHKLGARRWHLLQEADEIAVDAVKRAAAEDSLLGELHTSEDDDEGADEIGAAEALRRQRTGVLGDPSLKQSSPGPATWQQQR